MSQLQTIFVCLNYSQLYSQASIIFQEDDAAIHDPDCEKVDAAFARIFPHLKDQTPDHIDDDGEVIIHAYEMNFYMNLRTIVFIGHSYPGNSDIRAIQYNRK